MDVPEIEVYDDDGQYVEEQDRKTGKARLPEERFESDPSMSEVKPLEHLSEKAELHPAILEYYLKPHVDANKLELLQLFDRMFSEIREAFTRIARRDRSVTNLVTIMAELAPIEGQVQRLREFDWEFMEDDNEEHGRGTMGVGLVRLASINKRAFKDIDGLLTRLPYEVMADVPPMTKLFKSIKGHQEITEGLESDVKSTGPHIRADVEFPDQSIEVKYHPLGWEDPLNRIQAFATQIIRQLGDFVNLTDWEYARLRSEKPATFFLIEQCTMSSIITTSLLLTQSKTTYTEDGLPQQIFAAQSSMARKGDPESWCMACFCPIVEGQERGQMVCDQMHVYHMPCVREYFERVGVCLLCYVNVNFT